jgi:hypothetical protein
MRTEIKRLIKGALFPISCLLPSILAMGAPPAGPFGPIAQDYQVPHVEGRIYYVAPDGDPAVPGETPEAPTSIEVAIAKVVTGDAIILRGGTYRTGNLLLNQGILMQPYREETPVLKGTKIATSWEKQPNGLWVTTWNHLFPEIAPDWWRRESWGAITAPHLFNYDMVFLNGKWLKSVGWEGELDEESFFINYDTNKIYLKADPTDKVVEITAFDNAITRVTSDVHGKASDRKGPSIRGITFTQYAYRAIEIEGTEGEGLTDPALIGKEVVGTLLEHLTLSYCSRVGGYFRGDDMVIRHCLVTHTGMEGIYVISSGNLLLERNIVTQTNIENLLGVFPTAIKVFNQCYDAVVRENLIIDNPNSSGLWYDVGNIRGKIYNNWFIRTDNGFFFEISKEALCVGNVFIDCNTGVFVLNSSDVELYNNTFYNSAIKIQRTPRSAEADHFGWHPAAGPDVHEREGHKIANNLFVADSSYSLPPLQFIQDKELCDRLTQPQAASIGANVWVRRGFETGLPMISWSPTGSEPCSAEYRCIASWQKENPGFGKGSVQYDHFAGPLFLGLEIKRYELDPAFPAAGVGDVLPSEVLELIGAAGKAPFPGAFAP